MMQSETSSHSASRRAATKLNPFERDLSLWVVLCMLVGVVLGKFSPALVGYLRGLEFGRGSQINLPIAVFIWLMIIPMMMKVAFTAIQAVGRKPKGVLITLFVNWMGKPFSMALISWLFFRHFSLHGFPQPKPANTSPEPSFSPPLPAPPWFSCGAISRMATPLTPWFRFRSMT
jgi:hypothetical protein